MGRQTGRFNDDETVRKRSGWIIPVSVFAVTFALSALILLYYLAPSAGLFEEQAAPTSRSDIVALSVAGRPFRIPANYLIYDSARTGGERSEIAVRSSRIASKTIPIIRNDRSAGTLSPEMSK